MTSAPEDNRLREIAERATKGEWSTRGPHSRFVDSVSRHDLAYAEPEDAEFIATFDPPAVLALLDRIRELEGEYHRRGVKIIEMTEFAGAHLCRAEAAESRALTAEAERNDALALLDRWDDAEDDHPDGDRSLAARFSRLLEELRTGYLVSETARLAAEAQVSGLVEALKPFARYAENIEPYIPDSLIRLESGDATIKVRDLRRATRALLSPVHGVGGDQGAAVAESASEGLRPFAFDSVAEVGRSEP